MGVCHKGGVQAEARDGGLRDDARRLLRVSYERQVAGGGKVTHVDLGAGAEKLGMDAPATASTSCSTTWRSWVGWRRTCSPTTPPAAPSGGSPPAGWRSLVRPDPSLPAGG